VKKRELIKHVRISRDRNKKEEDKARNQLQMSMQQGEAEEHAMRGERAVKQRVEGDGNVHLKTPHTSTHSTPLFTRTHSTTHPRHTKRRWTWGVSDD